MAAQKIASVRRGAEADVVEATVGGGLEGSILNGVVVGDSGRAGLKGMSFGDEVIPCAPVIAWNVRIVTANKNLKQRLGLHMGLLSVETLDAFYNNSVSVASVLMGVGGIACVRPNV